MKVLTYKNEDFIDRYSGRYASVSLEDARKKTRELLKKHIGSLREREIGEETEELMELYSINEEE